MIINGSPRAPKSNSRKYAELFMKYSDIPSEYYAITAKNHLELCSKIDQFSCLLFVFPLYADGIPVTLMKFLKTLEENPPTKKPQVSVLVNCGFFEPEQNNIAIKMLQLFCKEQNYPFGASLKVGSGEAILDTPFRFFVKRKIRQLAKSISNGRDESLQVTMPITKRLFIKASSKYWQQYGRRNGITAEQMSTMKIE